MEDEAQLPKATSDISPSKATEIPINKDAPENANVTPNRINPREYTGTATIVDNSSVQDELVSTPSKVQCTGGLKKYSTRRRRQRITRNISPPWTNVPCVLVDNDIEDPNGPGIDSNLGLTEPKRTKECHNSSLDESHS